MAGKLMKPKLGGAVYVLPNLITTGNLFFGYFSIVKSLQGDLRGASLAILLASIFDVLDGRVARLTGGTSEFGVQYDSLCDLVSFGLAPAILMYQGGLGTLGRLGWSICFLFLACGALRLARFNVQSAIGKASGDFTGLPIPMAAAVVATFMAVITDITYGDFAFLVSQYFIRFFPNGTLQIGFYSVVGVALALAMVSNIVYRSHKSIKIAGIKPFKLLVVLVVAVGMIAYQPELFGFLFFFLYALSGPVEWLLGWRKPTEEEEIFATGDEASIEAEEDKNDSSRF
jgi:CDP-diacylglycerol--serine O-phosphatidyltransferase